MTFSKIISKFKTSLAFQLISVVVLYVVFLSLLITIIDYNEFINSVEKFYSMEAYNTANTAADFVTPDYRENSQEIIKIWRVLVNNQKVSFITLVRPVNKEYSDVEILLNAKNDDLKQFQEFPIGHIYKHEDKRYIDAFRRIYEEGSPHELIIIYNPVSVDYVRNHVVALTPVKDSDGKIIGVVNVEMPMVLLEPMKEKYLREVAISTVIVVITIITLYKLYFRKNVIKPIQIITQEARRFAHENKRPKENLSKVIHQRNEIWQLARTIDFMENELLDYLKNFKTVATSNERIQAELRIATQIQADILPRKFPAFPERKEFDIYATMTPAKEVGGDFYDFFMIDGEHLVLVMADVSDKGIPAALFMVSAKNAIKNRAQMGGSPSEILHDVNNQLIDGNDAQLFVTVWLGILEISTGKIKSVNAGHEYPAIYSSSTGKYEITKSKNSPVLALMDGIKFKESEFELKPGDSLFLYTDGVPEARNSKDELFGLERMLEALNHSDNFSPEKVLSTVKYEIGEFTQGVAQFDDTTMLCLKYFG